MAKGPPPPPSGITISYPNGDTVQRNFNCSGTSSASTIAAVAVYDTNDNQITITWQVINQPGDNNGNFLISVTLPTTADSTGDPYSITVVDSDTNSATNAFSL